MEQYNANEKKQCMGCMEFYGTEYDICPHCGYEEGQSAEALLHIDPGTLLVNRYIIGRALGYGGFGVTYMAWDTQLKRKLAIKEYLPSEFATRMIHHQNLLISSDEKIQQQYVAGMKKFLNEGQKLAQVRNVDGIVHMYDCFEANNTAYITMEYLEGETLAAFLEREGHVSEQDAMDFVMPVLQALETVHEKGIIHRDIAPDNLFLTRDANGDVKVKLIDFGAAKFATTSHSKSLTVLIKPGYSPEEQYRSNGDQGTYTDIYALAAVLYRMVTGVQPPDAFERRTMIETKKKDPLEEPAKYNRDLSANFENALMNALNVRIEDRTATVADFEEELISFEPVKRRGSSIRRIDFMRWPLWAKIGVPIGSLCAISLLICGLIVAFTNPNTIYELPEGMTRVPDFVTADFEQAQEWAGEAILLIGSTGTEYVPNAAENVVLSQDVHSGAVVLENTMVSVIVSTGEESYFLPDVTGMSVEYAQKALECMGLEITVDSFGPVGGLAAGCVVSQNIDPYTEVQTGDSITITVTNDGQSNDGTAINFVGLTYEEALDAASAAGLTLCITEKVFTDEYVDTQILSQTVKEGTALKAGDVIHVTMAVPVREFTMPNLLYKPLETAKQLLKNIGINFAVENTISEIIAKDLVAEQSVEKAKTVMPGDTVVLTVSSGSKPFAMPNVEGKTEEEARKILTDSTLVVNVEYGYDQNVAVDCVISQTVKANTDVTRGTSVTIVVCSTDGLVNVPSVKGMTAEEARKTLEDMGLIVMIEEMYGNDDDAGCVIDQLPKASTYQKEGTTVVLTVSKGAKRTAVPNVVGMSKSSAVSELKAAGFVVSTVEVYDTDSTKGKVISQSPEAGTSQIDGTTITLKVSIGQNTVSSIAVKSKPDKTNYYVGDTLNTTGLSLTVTYANGSTKTVSSGFTCSPTTLSSAGTQTITVTYSEKKTTFTVNVESPAVSSIAIKSKPSKTSYYVGDTLNTAGLSLTVTYANGSTKTVSSDFSCSPTTLSSAGTQTITVTYSGKTTSFTVNVEKPVVTSIAVKSKPNKTSYTTGETLNAAGLTLTATYSNGATETVSNGFSCTPTLLTSAGTQTITVTYSGKTTSFTVTVTDPTVTGIAIKSNPSKTSYYIGDSLDTSGLTLTATYSNGTTKTVSSGFSCSPGQFTSSGSKTITVTYGGKTATFSVSVTSPSISLSMYSNNITMECYPSYYSSGLDVPYWKLSLPTVTTTPGNGTVKWSIVSGSAFVAGDNSFIGAWQPGTVVARASYTYNGYTYSADYTVTWSMYKIPSATNYIKSEPSKGSSSIGSVPTGATVTITSIAWDYSSRDSEGRYWLWGKVTYGGVTGWIVIS